MDTPEVVTQSEWLEARKALLAKEKEATRLRDELSAERRRLPMVEIEKDYRFAGTDGEVGLADLFEGRSQLLIYHFMWLDHEGAGCPSCSYVVDNIGDLRHLHARDTTLALVSRGPLDDLESYRRRMGWEIPWYSSLGSDFNYDFHVTSDRDVAPVEYNYRDETQLVRDNPGVAGLEGRAARHERVPARRRPRLSHLLGLRARARHPDGHEQLARSDGARQAGEVGAAARPQRRQQRHAMAAPSRRVFRETRVPPASGGTRSVAQLRMSLLTPAR